MTHYINIHNHGKIDGAFIYSWSIGNDITHRPFNRFKFHPVTGQYKTHYEFDHPTNGPHEVVGDMRKFINDLPVSILCITGVNSPFREYVIYPFGINGCSCVIFSTNYSDHAEKSEKLLTRDMTWQPISQRDDPDIWDDFYQAVEIILQEIEHD